MKVVGVSPWCEHIFLNDIVDEICVTKSGGCDGKRTPNPLFG